MNDNQKLNEIVNTAIEITIRLGFLLLLIAWCFQLLYPFTGVIVWGIILAVAVAPFYDSVNRRLGDKPKWSAILIILVGLILIILPSWLFIDSMINGLKTLKSGLEGGTLTIPVPTEKVASWPVIGSKAYDIWQQASQNLEGFITKYREQILKVGETLLEGGLSFGASVLQFILATIVAGILLATRGTDDFARRFFRKIVGAQGDEFTDITIKTISNVTKGVLGVALIQSLLTGLGFVLAGIPYAGVWTLLVLVLAILQLPGTIVVIPIVIWMFSAFNPLPAVLWTIYLLLAGASDNVLKPLLLGKGAPVPMLVIFLGVIGGFMLSGFIGLFTGAIIISLGYKLFESWIKDDGEKKENTVASTQAK
jgi:predicted PurR-regulated permease PerM